MDMGIATLGGAAIAGFASVFGIIYKFRNENRSDHGKVMEVLERIDAKVDRVGDRVSDHIDWHLKEGPGGRIGRRTARRGSE